MIKNIYITEIARFLLCLFALPIVESVYASDEAIWQKVVLPELPIVEVAMGTWQGTPQIFVAGPQKIFRLALSSVLPGGRHWQKSQVRMTQVYTVPDGPVEYLRSAVGSPGVAWVGRRMWGRVAAVGSWRREGRPRGWQADQAWGPGQDLTFWWRSRGRIQHARKKTQTTTRSQAGLYWPGDPAEMWEGRCALLPAHCQMNQKDTSYSPDLLKTKQWIAAFGKAGVRLIENRNGRAQVGVIAKFTTGATTTVSTVYQTDQAYIFENELIRKDSAMTTDSTTVVWDLEGFSSEMRQRYMNQGWSGGLAVWDGTQLAVRVLALPTRVDSDPRPCPKLQTAAAQLLVQKIRHIYGVSTRATSGMIHRLRRRAWLPDITIDADIDRGRKRGIDVDPVISSSSTERLIILGPEKTGRSEDLDAGWRFGLSLRWEPERLIYDSEERMVQQSGGRQFEDGLRMLDRMYEDLALVVSSGADCGSGAVRQALVSLQSISGLVGVDLWQN